MSGKLYIVGTPIGNLGDISPRALETLNAVDFIAAEDTRVTLKLLNHFDIKKETVSYYEHNKAFRGEQILARLAAGESCALVTDAGMPAISDPGQELVDSAHISGIAVESVPGPCALTTAIALSGLASKRFCFEGFLSVNKGDRKLHLEQLVGETRTMVFYEAPHKLLSTLKDLLAFLGDRKIAVAKELTKLHETLQRFSLSEAIEFYESNSPRGEFVLMVEGKAPEAETALSVADAVLLAKKLMSEGKSASFAAKQAATAANVKKNEIYKMLIED